MRDSRAADNRAFQHGHLCSLLAMDTATDHPGHDARVFHRCSDAAAAAATGEEEGRCRWGS